MAEEGYLVLQGESRANARQSMSHPRVNVIRGRPVFQRVWNDTISYRFHTKI